MSDIIHSSISLRDAWEENEQLRVTFKTVCGSNCFCFDITPIDFNIPVGDLWTENVYLSSESARKLGQWLLDVTKETVA